MFEDITGNIGEVNPIAYATGSKFDSDSVLEVCMGGGVECHIKDLTLLYNTFQKASDLLFWTYRKIITKSRKNNNFISNSDWKL